MEAQRVPVAADALWPVVPRPGEVGEGVELSPEVQRQLAHDLDPQGFRRPLRQPAGLLE